MRKPIACQELLFWLRFALPCMYVVMGESPPWHHKHSCLGRKEEEMLNTPALRVGETLAREGHRAC